MIPKHGSNEVKDYGGEAHEGDDSLDKIELFWRTAKYTSFTGGRRIDVGKIDLVSRLFYMQEMHKTYSGTGTVCTGVAALIQGTLMNHVTSSRASQTKMVRIGHPSGLISIEVDVEKRADGFYLKKALWRRTSRRTMEGFVYVPESLSKAE